MGEVEQAPVFLHRRVAAGNDVDVVAQRHFVEQRFQTIVVFGELEHRLARLERFVFNRQELHREVFGKHHEVGFVVGHRVDEVAHDVGEFIERADGPLQVLHGGHADGGRAAVCRRVGAGHVLPGVRVAPDHVRGRAARFGVGLQVFRQHAQKLEALPQLKIHHLVANLTGNHRATVFAVAADLFGAARVARQATAENDAVETQIDAQLAPRRVEALGQAPATKRRVNRHFIAVQHIAIFVVRRAEAVAGDLGPGMGPHRLVFGDDDGGAVADHRAVEFGNQMAFGKVVELSAQLVQRVAGLRRVGLLHQLADGRDVLVLRGTYRQRAGARHAGLIREM